MTQVTRMNSIVSVKECALKKTYFSLQAPADRQVLNLSLGSFI